MAGSRGLASKITSPVVVNRILERLPDYNPKGEGAAHFRGALSPPTPTWTFRLELNAISCVALITDRGYETHKSSRVWKAKLCGRVAWKLVGLRGNVWIKSKNGLASNFVQTFSILYISFSLLRFYDIGTGNFVEWIYSSRLHKVWKLIIFACYFNFHFTFRKFENRLSIISRRNDELFLEILRILFLPFDGIRFNSGGIKGRNFNITNFVIHSKTCSTFPPLFNRRTFLSNQRFSFH